MHLSASWFADSMMREETEGQAAEMSIVRSIQATLGE